ESYERTRSVGCPPAGMEITRTRGGTGPADGVRIPVCNAAIRLAEVLENASERTRARARTRDCCGSGIVPVVAPALERAATCACTNGSATYVTDIAGRLSSGRKTPTARREGGTMKRARMPLLVLLVVGTWLPAFAQSIRIGHGVASRSKKFGFYWETR